MVATCNSALRQARCIAAILVAIWAISADAQEQSAPPGIEAGAPSARPWYDAEAQARRREQVLEAATAAWFFVLGACIGSFLNVVVYRMPRGMSLGHPPSRCSSCGTRVARRDNLPVLGWILLRGRCRACRAAISPRYPLIEGLTGLLFLGLLYREVFSGGMNLPLREPNNPAGAAWTLWDPQWDLIGLYLYHLLLLCALLVAALVAADGLRMPQRFALTIGLLGLALPALAPELHPIPVVVPLPDWLSSLNWTFPWPLTRGPNPVQLGFSFRGLLDSLAGLAAGTALGRVVAAMIPRDADPGRLADSTVAVLALAGTFLGWQACLSVAAMTMFLAAASIPWLARRDALAARTLPALVAIAALAHVVAWRTLNGLVWWPGHTASLAALAGTFAGTLALTVLVRVVIGFRRRGARV